MKTIKEHLEDIENEFISKYDKDIYLDDFTTAFAEARHKVQTLEMEVEQLENCNESKDKYINELINQRDELELGIDP